MLESRPYKCSCVDVPNIIPGTLWITGQCRLCWLYEHSVKHRKRWKVEGAPTPIATPPQQINITSKPVTAPIPRTKRPCTPCSKKRLKKEN